MAVLRRLLVVVVVEVAMQFAAAVHIEGGQGVEESQYALVRSGRVMLLVEVRVYCVVSSACLSRSCQAYRSNWSGFWLRTAEPLRVKKCLLVVEVAMVLAVEADIRHTFQAAGRKVLKFVEAGIL